MGWGEGYDFYVFEAGLAAGGDDFEFADFFFSFGVDEPESRGAFDGFCGLGDG